MTASNVAMGLRDGKCGWAFSNHTCTTPRPIGTLKASSILHHSQRATLFDSIVVAMHSLDTNFMEIIEPAVASVLVFASQLHCVADAVHFFASPPESPMESLRAAIREFASSTTDARAATLAADALVLINALYPTSLEVGENCLLGAIA